MLGGSAVLPRILPALHPPRPAPHPPASTPQPRAARRPVGVPRKERRKVPRTCESRLAATRLGGRPSRRPPSPHQPGRRQPCARRDWRRPHRIPAPTPAAHASIPAAAAAAAAGGGAASGPPSAHPGLAPSTLPRPLTLPALAAARLAPTCPPSRHRRMQASAGELHPAPAAPHVCAAALGAKDELRGAGIGWRRRRAAVLGCAWCHLTPHTSPLHPDAHTRTRYMHAHTHPARASPAPAAGQG